MTWCFLVNTAPFLSDFFLKLSKEVVRAGDECLIVFTSKFVEYEKRHVVPEGVRVVSFVDWCLQSPDIKEIPPGKLSWKDFFPVFDRFKRASISYKTATERITYDYAFFRELIETKHIDAFFFEPPSGVNTQIAYLLAKEKKIPYIGLLTSKIYNHLDLLDSKYTDSRYGETFARIQVQDLTAQERKLALEYMNSFVSHKKILSYMGLQKIRFSPVGFLRHYGTRGIYVGKILWRYAKIRRKARQYDFEAETRWIRSIRAPFETLRRQARIRAQRSFYRFADKTDAGRFFLFPLHLQPEISTSVFATYYNDQLNTIRNTAFALPFPYKLYVREHPSAIGTKPDKFYEEIQKIPQVVLISAEESPDGLIKDSCGVIVLSSTIGMEAVLVGKPVYALGDVFYEYHPLCRNVANFEELKTAIEKDQKNPPDIPNVEEINMRFIVSYMRHTVPGTMTAAVNPDDPNDYREIYRAFRKRIKEIQGVGLVDI
jgi:hypothetical protein